MNRVSADLAEYALHREAVRTGDKRLRIRKATLRTWVRRGYITYRRDLGGYDLAEIKNYLDRRGTRGHHRPA